MRILYMGTPDFAMEPLRLLAESGHTICGVITQPDKPKGRGHKLTPPPVKVLAEELGIPVYQPTKLKDNALLPLLEELQPELIAVTAYGRILPPYILNFPRYGCVNLHASLLPKYRGAAPIQWAVIDGEEKSGVTTMLMNEGLDTGDMLLKAEVEITPETTGGMLHDALMEVGAPLLLETVNRLEEGTIVPEPQDDSKSCYAPMLNKENCRIDWNRSAKEIVRLIRGLNPFPAAYTILDGMVLKVYNAEASALSGEPGKLLASEKELIVGCADGSVTLTDVMLAGKKRMSAADLLRGYRPKEIDR